MSLAELDPQIPRPLSDLVKQLLAKNADDRPASALAVVDRLTAIEQQLAPRKVAKSRLAFRWSIAAQRAHDDATASLPSSGSPCCSPSFIFFSAQLIRIITNKGAIVVEVDDPSVDVTVAENQVVLHDGRGQAEITLAAGEHTLAVTLKLPSGVSAFETVKFTLERGGKKIIQARKELERIAAASIAALPKSTATAPPRDPSPKSPVSPPVPTDPDHAAAAWTLSQGGFVYVRTEPGAHAVKVTSARELPAGRFDLTSVNLNGRAVTDADLPQFHGLAHLIEFALNGAPVTDAGVAWLHGFARTQAPGPLEHARDRHRPAIGQHALQARAALSRWCAPITDAGLKHLAGLSNLTYLDLINTPVTDAAFVELAHLPKLTTLFLDRTSVTDLGLAQIRGVSHLRELSLCRLPISDTGLANVRGLPNLRSLRLCETRVTDAGLASLADMPHLDMLALENTAVTKKGLVALERLKTLKILSLRGLYHLDDLAVPTLVHLQGLLKLDIRDCHISENGFAALKAALPNRRIEWSEPNDEAAKSVLGASGTVDVILDAGGEKRHIKTIAELPTQPFRLAAVQLSGTCSPLYQPIMAMKHRALDRLASIDLSNTPLDDGDVERLQAAPAVRELNIAHTRVTDKCLTFLKSWHALERLNLTGTAINGSGLLHLQSLSALRDLRLGGPNVNDLFLVELNGLKQLERLGLSKGGFLDSSSSSPRPTHATPRA